MDDSESLSSASDSESTSYGESENPMEAMFLLAPLNAALLGMTWTGSDLRVVADGEPVPLTPYTDMRLKFLPTTESGEYHIDTARAQDARDYANCLRELAQQTWPHEARVLTNTSRAFERIDANRIQIKQFAEPSIDDGPATITCIVDPRAPLEEIWTLVNVEALTTLQAVKASHGKHTSIQAFLESEDYYSCVTAVAAYVEAEIEKALDVLGV